MFYDSDRVVPIDFIVHAIKNIRQVLCPRKSRPPKILTNMVHFKQSSVIYISYCHIIYPSLVNKRQE